MLIYLFLISCFAVNASAGVDITDIVSESSSSFTAVTTKGEVISSNHSTEHKAQMQAIKWLQENCNDKTCVAYIERNYRSRIEAENSEYKAKTALITWDAPEQREDGSELKPVEIDRYIARVVETLESGTTHETKTTVRGLQMKVTMDQGSTYSLKLRTVDTNNNFSRWSETINL